MQMDHPEEQMILYYDEDKNDDFINAEEADCAEVR